MRLKGYRFDTYVVNAGNFSFSASMLLVERLQEGHPASKKLGVGLVVTI